MSYDCCPNQDTCSHEETSSEFIRGNSNFSILYSDNDLRVYKNPSGEIFIESVRYPNMGLRVGMHNRNLVATASKGNLAPTSVSGLDAFKVNSRIKA